MVEKLSDVLINKDPRGGGRDRPACAGADAGGPFGLET